ncbi:MAG TPA: MBL fold metallo-hydrolase [Bacillales bacterium]|nr:MBL fold metallo-hydrolase [Bacillales bacterium]
MSMEQIGPIEILVGENNSKVPFSTSLLLNDKEGSVLIDCGGGSRVFDYLKQKNIAEIYLTHYHLDHIWGAHLFPDAKLSINPYDLKKVSNPREMAKASGIYALYGEKEADRWLERQLNKPETDEFKLRWKPVLNITDQVYPYEQTIDVAGTNMTILHTPGHTEGYCSPYFPEYGVLYAGDFDLTSFGPWYNDADSDIDQFFESAERTLEVDAKYYVTGHHKGTFERSEYKQRLRIYIDKIREREENTKVAIQKGVFPKDIVYQEIFYLLKNHRQHRRHMGPEILGIAKHIQHLIKQGYPFEDYFRDFVKEHGLHTEWLNYRSEPEIT